MHAIFKRMRRELSCANAQLGSVSASKYITEAGDRSKGPDCHRVSVTKEVWDESVFLRLGVSYCKDLGDKMKCVVSVDRLGCGLHESC